MLSLFKLACIALTPEQHTEINKDFNDRMYIDVKACCILLHHVVENNEFNPRGERRLMYEKAQYGVEFNVGIYKSAIIYGHIDCLKMACEMGFQLQIADNALRDLNQGEMSWVIIECFSLGLCAAAAYYGHLTCLEYLRQQGVLWDWRTCTVAIQNRNIDCLIYAVENGCPLDSSQPFEVAAYSGNLSALKYLHEHGCPWSEMTCAKAALGGHLDCLQYLHDNGCPWDMSTCIMAIREKHFDCLKFTIEKGCPYIRSELINEAKIIENQQILTYLVSINEYQRDLPTCTKDVKNETLTV